MGLGFSQAFTGHPFSAAVKNIPNKLEDSLSAVQELSVGIFKGFSTLIM